MLERRRVLCGVLSVILIFAVCIPVSAAVRLPQNEPAEAMPASISEDSMRAYNQELYGLQYTSVLAPVNPQSVVSGKTIDGEDIPAFAGDYVIDMENEWIYKSNDAAPRLTHISLDGGNSFKPIKDSVNGKILLGKVFGKNAVSIVLISDFDSAAKKPAVYAEEDEEAGISASSGSVKYIFPPIAARPALPKLSIDYYTLRDQTGETNGKWTLAADKTAVSDLGAYQIAIAGSDKKTPDKAGWGKSDAGVAVLPLLSSGKQSKTPVLVRVAAKESPLTPASKTKRLSALGVSKAPKFKIDYKKEQIKVKADTVFSVASEYWENQLAEEADAFLWENQTDLAAFTKEAAKTGVSLYYNDTDGTEQTYYGKTLLFRILPSSKGKKPSTAIQPVTISDIPIIIAGGMASPTLSGGKMRLPAGYEAKIGDKWKTTVPADTGSALVRMKNTAKYNQKNNSTSGQPASNTLTFTFGLGYYDLSNQKKTGIATYGVTDDLYGYSLMPKDFPLIQNVTTQAALDAITQIVFEPVNQNPMPEGTLKLKTNLSVEGESPFYDPIFDHGTRTLTLTPGTLRTGTCTFTLLLEDDEGNTVPGFFCPVIIVHVINPNDPTKVAVTLDESIYADSEIINMTYSISSATAAVNGLNFPEKGVNVSIGTTIYIQLTKRDGSGKIQTQLLTYRALATDAADGKALTLVENWTEYVAPTCTGAAASSGGGTIVVTFTENVTIVSAGSFELGGKDLKGNSISNVRIDTNKKNVIITLKNPIEKGDELTLSFTEKGVKTVTGYLFNEAHALLNVNTADIVVPTPEPTATPKPTLPPTPTPLDWI